MVPPISNLRSMIGPALSISGIIELSTPPVLLDVFAEGCLWDLAAEVQQGGNEWRTCSAYNLMVLF